MLLVAKVKLLPEPAQQASLEATLRAANAACNWISEAAWNKRCFSTYPLHRLTYREARRRFGLSAQLAARSIAKVADAYRLDHRARRVFAATGGIPYDDRILTWHDGAVSIRAEGRRLKMAFVCGPRQAGLLTTRRGESVLLLQRGEFYLAAACEVKEPEPQPPEDVLGVDLGIANIASDSDGVRYTGSEVKSVRHRQRRLRRKLQRKHTTSATRRLKKLAGKEQRFARHVNHVVSKQIVARAEGTGRAIAIEELGGIRERVKVGRGQRAVLHSWAFFQLRTFLEYKAKLAGVPLVPVDPRYTSRECSQCHYVSKSNRPNQSTFRCAACGFAAHADFNAAVNLRERGRAACKPAIRGSRLSADRPAKLPAFSR